MGTGLPSLGPRGEGGVVAQSVLGAGVVVLGLVGPGWSEGPAGALLVGGLAIGAAGLLLFAWGVAALGSSLPPYPRPHERASLRSEGIYRHVRHPIYGGGVLMALGWSLALSPLALVATVLLWLLLAVKGRHQGGTLARRGAR